MKIVVLVCSSCCNKNTINWWLINNINLFFTVLEARMSEIKGPADLVSGGACFPVHRQQSSHCVPTQERGQETSLGSLL